LLLAGLFLSALATETLGIHALFGAFLAGAVLPGLPRLKAFLKERLEYPASLYLLPVFFAATGLRTELGLLAGARDWGLAFLILALAVAGQFGGACLAARFTGTPWKPSLALGALMNTRGLMELIVLNIGLDLGILSPTLFSMLVLMALATTAMTGPALSLLGVGRRS
jgi:Kef-type K+ transport system membrane component KefB